MDEVTDEPLYRDRVCGIDIGNALVLAARTQRVAGRDRADRAGVQDDAPAGSGVDVRVAGRQRDQVRWRLGDRDPGVDAEVGPDVHELGRARQDVQGVLARVAQRPQLTRRRDDGVRGRDR